MIAQICFDNCHDSCWGAEKFTSRDIGRSHRNQRHWARKTNTWIKLLISGWTHGEGDRWWRTNVNRHNHWCGWRGMMFKQTLGLSKCNSKSYQKVIFVYFICNHKKWWSLPCGIWVRYHGDKYSVDIQSHHRDYAKTMKVKERVWWNKNLGASKKTNEVEKLNCRCERVKKRWMSPYSSKANPQCEVRGKVGRWAMIGDPTTTHFENSIESRCFQR